MNVDDQSTKRLLLSITSCPQVPLAYMDSTHDCSSVVHEQPGSLDAFHLPEPWNGELDVAPLLFISSNPGLGLNERYPTANKEKWDEDRIADFFTHRFGGGRETWTNDKLNRAIQADGTFPSDKRSQTVFWPRVWQQAQDIFQRDVNPGTDFAITEVVHCKSDNARGVQQAVSLCTSLHLHRVLQASPARLLVVLGKKAQPAFRQAYPEIGACIFEEGDQTVLTQPIEIASRLRHVLFFKHPSGGRRLPSQYVSPEGMAIVRKHIGL